jgi:hypothetical protein
MYITHAQSLEINVSLFCLLIAVARQLKSSLIEDLRTPRLGLNKKDLSEVRCLGKEDFGK